MRVFWAYVRSWCHVVSKLLFKLEPHQEIVYQDLIRIAGVLDIPVKTHYIGCTCGKVFYGVVPAELKPFVDSVSGWYNHINGVSHDDTGAKS